MSILLARYASRWSSETHMIGRAHQWVGSCSWTRCRQGILDRPGSVAGGRRTSHGQRESHSEQSSSISIQRPRIDLESVGPLDRDIDQSAAARLQTSRSNPCRRTTEIQQHVRHSGDEAPAVDVSDELAGSPALRVVHFQ